MVSSLPVTEVSLEPPVEELEQALEKELQAARDADAQRENEARQASREDDVDDVQESGEDSPPADASPAEANSSGAGQGSLF